MIKKVICNLMAKGAFEMAKMSVNRTCIVIIHQPKVMKELNKYRRF